MAKKKTNTTTVDTKDGDKKPKELTIGKITGYEWENVLIIARAIQLTPRNKNESDDSYYKRISNNINENAKLTINSDTIRKYWNVTGVPVAATNIINSLDKEGSYIKKLSASGNVTPPYVDNTPKTDILCGNKRVSLKKAGGSRLMSGQSSDASGVFYGALNMLANEKNGFNLSIDEKSAKTLIDSIITQMGSDSMNLKYALYELSQAMVQQWILIRYNSIANKIGKKTFNKPIDIDTDFISMSKFRATEYDQDIINHALLELRGVNKELFTKYVENIEPINGVPVLRPDVVKRILEKRKSTENKILDAVGVGLDEKLKQAMEINKTLTESINDMVKNIVDDSQFKKCCIFEAATGVYKFSKSTLFSTNENSHPSIPTHLVKFDNNGNIDIFNTQNGNEFVKKLLGETDPDNAVTLQVSFKTSNNIANRVLNMLIGGRGIKIKENKKNKNKKYTLFSRIMSKMIKEHSRDLSKSLLNFVLTKNSSISEGIFDDLKNTVKNAYYSFVNKIKNSVLSTLNYFLKNGLNYFMKQFDVQVDGTATVNIQF